MHADKGFVKNEHVKRKQVTKSYIESNMILILKMNIFP